MCWFILAGLISQGGHISFLLNFQHAEAVSENPYQIVTDELSLEISVMYLKLKAAAMHRFRLNGLATAQPASHLEDFQSQVVWISCPRVLKARASNFETQYPLLRQMKQKWSPEPSVKLSLRSAEALRKASGIIKGAMRRLNSVTNPLASYCQFIRKCRESKENCHYSDREAAFASLLPSLLPTLHPSPPSLNA